MTDRIFLISLAVFLLLYGLFAITNFAIVWGPALVGFSALIAGICAGIKALRKGPGGGV
jgi:uncharacterized membrane protein HdeD (DUF308 family)